MSPRQYLRAVAIQIVGIKARLAMFALCSILLPVLLLCLERGVGVQLSFEWLPAPLRRTERLTFAILPDDTTAAWIERYALRWRERLNLVGWPIPAKCLHISLYGLGEHEALPKPLVERACRAADTVTCEPFDVGFDRCGEFGGGAIVLYGHRRIPALLEFRRRLGIALLTEPALARFVVRRPYAPHVTMLYRRDARPFEEQSIEPIGWTVREFVLVHSLVGRRRHVHLGRWRLAQRREAAVSPPSGSF
jgi:2'-5' RNA ligase